MSGLMHRALGILEVVEEIIEHVPQYDLPSLAATARLFVKPVRAKLWRDIDHTTITTLVRHIIEAAHGEAGTDEKTLSRCRYLAKFTRSIEMSWWLTGRDVRMDFPAGLTLLRCPSHPFPRLRNIDAFAEAPEAVEVFDMMLCPTVEKFSLHMMIDKTGVDVLLWEQPLFALLGTLTTKAPRVADLQIRGRTESDVMAGFEHRLAELLSVVSRDLPLVRFAAEAIPFDPDLIGCLASKTNLESMKLYTPCPTPEQLNSKRYRDVYSMIDGFRALRQVALQGTAKALGAILRLLTRSELEDVELDLFDWNASVSDILRVACKFARSITKFSLSEWFSRDFIPEYSSPLFIIPTDVFMHLADCSLMKSFRFHFSHAPGPLVDLCNSHLEVLARTWTQLEYFHLTNGQTPSDLVTPLTLDLGTLLPFARYCPNLYYIAIRPMAPYLRVDFDLPFEGERPWAVTVGYPDNFDTLPFEAFFIIARYLDALWDDVRVTKSWGKEGPCVQLINDSLSYFRTERASQVSSIGA